MVAPLAREPVFPSNAPALNDPPGETTKLDFHASAESACTLAIKLPTEHPGWMIGGGLPPPEELPGHLGLPEMQPE